MPQQLLLKGFPEGATAVGQTLRILQKEGMVTYFVGGDNYFSHPAGDASSRRFAFATLMLNGHVRPCDLEEPPLCIPHRTLMNWCKQLRENGSSSFYKSPPLKKPRVMTPERVEECGRLLSEGKSPSDVSKQVGIDVSTLRKAIQRGAVSPSKKKKIFPKKM